MPKIKFWQGAGYFCLFFCLLLNSLHLFKGDIAFHADIARDFLVMDEMVSNHKLTLIGPKSGGVTGVFHGPAWYYLSLPAFLLTHGNPASMGIFWFFLYLLGTICAYFLLRKLFDGQIALLTITLWSSLTIFLPQNFLQSTSAIFFTIPILYLLTNYLRSCHMYYLVAGLFCIGMVIQFQMAFGVPVLLAVSFYLVFFIMKQRHYLHLLAFLILLLPLSTYLLFDLRHDFLQINAVWQYFSSSKMAEFNFSYYLGNRLLALVNCFAFCFSTFATLNILSGLVSLLIFFVAPFFYRRVLPEYQHSFLISYLMIFGFWLLTIPFRGEIHPYYYEMLTPVICLWLTFFLSRGHWQRLSRCFLLSMIICNLLFGGYRGWVYINNADTADALYWRFYRQLANDVFADSAGQDFSYYAWTPDQLGYPSKYAMLYMSKQGQQHIGVYQKTPLTYLLIAKNDAKHNPWVNPLYWRVSQVRINREPDYQWEYTDGFVVEKYLLSTTEAAVEADPNLISGLHFR